MLSKWLGVNAVALCYVTVSAAMSDSFPDAFEASESMQGYVLESVPVVPEPSQMLRVSGDAFVLCSLLCRLVLASVS